MSEPAAPADPGVESAKRDPHGPSPAPLADRVSAALGIGAALWLAIGLMPGPLPAWPSVSLGLLAWIAAWPRGRALPRAIGVFAGLLGVLGGGIQLAALWGLVRLLGT